MTDRTFFTDDEWSALSQAPLHVTTAVIAVAEHGPISLLKEASATAKALARPGDHGPATELIAAIAHEAQGHDARHAAKSDRAPSPEAVVDAALAELQPADFRYTTYRLADGVTFVHVAELAGTENPLSTLPAFAEFQRDVAERCVEPPVANEAIVVGSYGQDC